MDPSQRLVLSDRDCADLAEAFGTPLYVVSEAVFRSRIRRWRAAFAAASPDAHITYASKANSTAALLRIAWQEGCTIDAASEGELRAAFRAGVPPIDCHLHGNNKSMAELEFACAQGVGCIVVDCMEELSRLDKIPLEKPPLMLRLTPGVKPLTHDKVSVGQSDSKFGFNIGMKSAEKALLQALDQKLNVEGFHCHVGSQLLDPGAQLLGARALAEFAKDMKDRHGFQARVINCGGGMGIPTQSGKGPIPVEEYCQKLVAGIEEALLGSEITPRLVQEPGRSLVGPAGSTLYSIGVVKTVPLPPFLRKTYVAVDGGLADNPRPALYQSEYELRHVRVGSRGPTDSIRATVVGRHCETDVLFPDVVIGGDVSPGDLIQVLDTGAYNSSMASNYNRYPRPKTVLLREDGRRDLIQRQETWDEMLAREQIPGDL
jgi:diaminopimelate decarboxylase